MAVFPLAFMSTVFIHCGYFLLLQQFKRVVRFTLVLQWNFHIPPTDVGPVLVAWFAVVCSTVKVDRNLKNILKWHSQSECQSSYSGFSVSSFTSKTHLQLQWNIFITPVRQAVNLQMLCLAYKTTHTKIHKLLWMYSTDVAVLAVSYSYINLFFFHCCFSSDSFLMFNVCKTTDKLLTSYE